MQMKTRHVKQPSIYMQIKNASLPLMKGFETDVTLHDRQWLAKNPGVPFLHFVRELGSDLLPMHHANHESWPKAGERVRYLFGWATREHILRGAVIMAQARRKEHNTLICHWSDGEKLRVIDTDKAVEIAREYERILLKEWGSRKCSCGSCSGVV